MSTSLSRALEREKSQTKGAFEACFAQGLDLSEFAAKGGTNASVTSASAALLQVKAKESAAQKQHEQEDMRLEQLAKERAENLKKASSLPTKKISATALTSDRPSAGDRSKMVGNLLVHMHQGDDKKSTGKGSRIRANQGLKQNNKAPKYQANSRTQQFTSSKTQKGKTPVKAKKRSKY